MIMKRDEFNGLYYRRASFCNTNQLTNLSLMFKCAYPELKVKHEAISNNKYEGVDFVVLVGEGITKEEMEREEKKAKEKAEKENKKD